MCMHATRAYTHTCVPACTRGHTEKETGCGSRERAVPPPLPRPLPVDTRGEGIWWGAAMIDFEDLDAAEEQMAPAWRDADLAARAARSARERARTPTPWRPPAACASPVRGLVYGVELPSSEAELLRLGPAWLTRAFHAAGTIPESTAVRSIRSVRELAARGFADGLGAETQLLVEVAYAPHPGALHTQLLAKICGDTAAGNAPPGFRPGAAVALRGDNCEGPAEDSVGVLGRFLGASQECEVVMPDGEVRMAPLEAVELLQSEPGYEEHFARFVEVNGFRLLEGGAAFSMPRYYFGDAGGDGSSILITAAPAQSIGESLPPQGGLGWWRGRDGLGEAPFARCELLARACGRLAGLHKAGRLGPPERVARAFTRAAAAGSRGGLAPSAGLGDKELSTNAAVLAGFVNSCSWLFPEGATTPASMKAYRAILVTGSANRQIFDEFCSMDEDYRVLGHDGLRVDGVSFSEGAVEVRDWSRLSLGSTGSKLWHALCCCDHGVVAGRLDELLAAFADACRESGGPTLNPLLLKWHFLLTVSVQISLLTESASQLYRSLSKDEWRSVRSLSDERLVGNVPLWQYVKSVGTALALVRAQDMVPLFEKHVGDVFAASIFRGMKFPEVSSSGAETPEAPGEEPGAARYFSVESRGGFAEVRAEAAEDSALVCRLQNGWLVVAVEAAARADDVAQGALAELLLPAPGWVRASDLRHVPACQVPALPDFGRLLAVVEFVGLMWGTRRQYQASSPMGSCITSSKKLYDELAIRERVTQLQTRLGHGSCRVAIGSFLAEREPRPWWPRGYRDWLHHSFLVFEDGTVADITADQFDKVPQLWYPADKERYSPDVQEADRAHALRHERVGLERWQELLEEDASAVSRTRSKWAALERQSRLEGEIQLARIRWQHQVQQAGVGVGRAPRDLDIREPLVLVGCVNGWDAEAALGAHRFEPCELDPARGRGAQRSRLEVAEVPGGVMAFQVL